MVAQPAIRPADWSPEPGLEATASDGASLPLASLWGEQPLVLVFLPPWDSPFCADNAAQLRDNADLFDDAAVTVAAVCDVPPADAQRFSDEHHLGYLLLSDVDGSLRTAFGVERHESPVAGGCATFIIDTTGLVRYEHRGADADDYPAVWTIVTEGAVITGAKVEPPPLPPRASLPPSLTAGPQQSQASPFIGAGSHRALRAGFSCGKCGFAEYDVLTVSTASGIWSRIFNFQHRKFSAVTCRRCSFTEFYKADATALANVFDLFVGR